MNQSQSKEFKAKQGIILLVDDQPEHIIMFRAVLDPHFFLRIAIRGELVLQIALAGGIDLILLDVVMPGMNGYEVCQELKQHPATREIPVVLLTCKESQDHEAYGLSVGAVDFIRKPSAPEILLARCFNTIAYQRAKEDLCRKNDELQQALKELKQALKIREDVERISQHDLKGPLSAILGVPEVLLADGNCTSGQKALLKLIERSGYNMLSMINKSLDLLKMENGTYQIYSEKFDLLEILKRMVGDLGKLIGSKEINISIDSDYSDGLGSFFVVGEKILSYQLFYNLMLNAIEASCGHGHIRIHLTSGDEFGMIRITNPGEVPFAIRHNFFDKYVTSGKVGGTGLGTYSAWLSAKTQGGKIELDASQPGETSVIVTLPTTSVACLIPGVSSTRCLRILMAEDVEENQVLFDAYLMDTSHFLVIVNDGSEAVSRVQEETFDVVFMDVQMPIMDGYTATQKIRQWEREMGRVPIPIIALSAHAMEIEVQRSQEAGCDRYLIKPINKNKLLSVLQEIANQSEVSAPSGTC